MVRHTINIPNETNEQVKAVLGDLSMEEFTAEALRRHASREYAVRQLLSDVEKAEASGLYPGTLEELGTDMHGIIDQAQSK